MFIDGVLDPTFLHQILRYDPETGKLFWLTRSSDLFDDRGQMQESNAARWNSRWAGTEAFTALRAGYRRGLIFRKIYTAHRVIWAMQTGDWPKVLVDHMDNDRGNNRWVNLRQATHSQNQCNKRMLLANTSGFKGVSLHKQNGKWQATISLHGKQRHLGYFDSPELAEHRVNAERRSLHTEFGRVA
ncbi:MAG: HNH endonuclease [Cypionkella sp.]|uniref:HNH endonuclease n=1 Tax=Cypionkella sp. TaxID=2811411 RepID=UPI00272F895D|nr:HNH endonuclease [Cypionkella sp.]MDP2047553.1 HNH endonuclease [Cypionkella sp.]